MKPFKVHNYMELRVGPAHTLETVVHINRSTLSWFNASATRNRDELVSIIERILLPAIFSDEIMGQDSERIPQLGQGGVPIEPIDLGRGHDLQTGRKRKRKSKKEILEERRRESELARETRVRHRDILYAHGEHLDLAYKIENLSLENEANLVLFGETKALVVLRKMPKRVSIWCHRKGTLDTEGQGSFRPVMVPLSALFQK